MALQLDLYNLYRVIGIPQAGLTMYAHLGTFLSRVPAVALAAEHIRGETGEDISPEVYFGRRGNEGTKQFVCETSLLRHEGFQ